ncbi:hypothetical protein Oweho_3053 [Owenweeksia hongkongensis DSM 17368]|uniref:Uncharacterized protein n=1 Tax=Owenweeksia hongkongensis (strain DSM 17368 / CIP 108786 / JCM 12287 / NRRL B-23963 / UST20020801) TaxID=926562 RepID=G8R2J6_OWEHD|nr:hypothetical protein [Owenweeksia hongkongensis]AEV34008.1 hypothetical protein Oweho_3053 [Owenweeksia hongkongensis DSM 17368]
MISVLRALNLFIGLFLLAGEMHAQYVLGEKEVAVFAVGGAIYANHDEYNKVLTNNVFAKLNNWSANAGFEGVIPIKRIFIKLSMTGSNQEHFSEDNNYNWWGITCLGASVGYNLLKEGKVSIVPFVGVGGQFEKLRLNGIGRMVNPDGTTYDYQIEGDYAVRNLTGQLGFSSCYRIKLKPKTLSFLLGAQAQYSRSFTSALNEGHYGVRAWLPTLDFNGASVGGVFALSTLIGLSF